MVYTVTLVWVSLFSLFGDEGPRSSNSTAMGVLGASLEPHRGRDLAPHLGFAGVGGSGDTDFL